MRLCCYVRAHVVFFVGSTLVHYVFEDSLDVWLKTVEGYLTGGFHGFQKSVVVRYICEHRWLYVCSRSYSSTYWNICCNISTKSACVVY